MFLIDIITNVDLVRRIRCNYISFDWHRFRRVSFFMRPSGFSTACFLSIHFCHFIVAVRSFFCCLFVIVISGVGGPMTPAVLHNVHKYHFGFNMQKLETNPSTHTHTRTLNGVRQSFDWDDTQVFILSRQVYIASSHTKQYTPARKCKDMKKNAARNIKKFEICQTVSCCKQFDLICL